MQKVHESDSDGENVIILSCDYLGDNGPSRRANGRYTVKFDPGHQFRILSWEIVVGEYRKELYEIYYPQSGQAIFPQSIVYHVAVKEQHDWASEQRWDFGEFTVCTVPDEEFYLPHYGFSEDVLETLSPNPLPRWALLVGGLMLLLTGLWLVRRQRQSDGLVR